jgi:tRNA threonylcarbamoyladenosine dehydratase
MDDFGFRFGGIARLYGQAALERLRCSHVLVVGIGGVGSWTVEALARTGVGRLTLVDLDDVCVSNINRQLHALDDTIGRSKAEVMAARARGISPGIRVDAVAEFFNADNALRLLGMDSSISGARPDVVVDAIDSMSNKARLIALCHGASIPVVVCGAAGGRRDPTQVRISDLANVTHDRLLSEVRKRLRKEHGFPRDGRRLRIDCVHSAEAQVFPGTDGAVCAERPEVDGADLRLNCASGFGSATFVTGTFGFAAAARAVAILTAGSAAASGGAKSPDEPSERT